MSADLRPRTAPLDRRSRACTPPFAPINGRSPGGMSPCRYEPSCSNYALEALEVHGFFKGSWLSIRRLGRCHPWGGHGWDPVPQRKAA